MRKQRKVVSMLVAAALLLSSLSLHNITKPIKADAASDSTFNDYSQDQIVEEMGAGWNLGNQLEAASNGVPGETYYGNPTINEELILAVKDAGFKSIRIPVSYLSMIGDGPDYTIDSTWLNRVQEVVDMCVDNDLYAIINIHGDGYNTVTGGWLLCNGSDQTTIKAKYEAVWQQIATRFADYDEHLIFESMNEEFDGTYGTPNTTYYSNINAYNQIFVDTVRQSGGNNDKRWLLIPGWNTDIDYTVGDYGFELPTDNYLSSECSGKRIMISVHYYSPWEFCGTESTAVTQWGDEAADSSKVASWGGQSYMKEQFKKLYDKFVAEGYPVVIGEYGAIDKTSGDSTNNTYRAYYCQTLCEYATQYGCIPVYWDNGYNGTYGFGLFDRYTYKVTQQGIIDAIMTYYASDETATSTAISLDQSEMTIYVGDEKKTITATLTPADSTDTIRWTSSNEDVATVNSKGQVTAVSVGTAVITATANGHSATCTVTVPENECIRAKMYLLESANWQSVESSEYVDIPATGGTYTLSLTGTESQLSNIGSLYIKDISTEDGSASVFDYAKLTVDNVTLNGTEYSMSEDTFIYDITATDSTVGTLKSAFDFSFINVWDSTYINDVTVESWNYKAYFNNASLGTSNTLAITFTVSDVVKDGSEVTPTTTPTATPTTAPTATPTAAPTTTPTAAPETEAPATTAPATETPDASDVTATLEVTNNWGTGGLANIVVKNTTGTDFTDGFTVAFDLNATIVSTWSGTIESSTDNHYVISSPSWNGSLAAGESYTISFKFDGDASALAVSNVTIY